MPNIVTLFRITTGLNTKVDPARLEANLETGLTPLAVAYNVDIDQSGRITRRRGYQQVYSGSVHSLFGGTNLCLFVSGTNLMILNPDYSTETIRSDLTAGLPMSYVEVDDKIYYMNGKEKGIVQNRSHLEWEPEEYVGPDTYKDFSDPPIGEFLEIFNGRMYIAQKNTIWYSEPFAYSWFHMADSWIPFPTDITLLKAVSDGLFVADSDKTYFLAGADAKEFSIREVVDYPAIKYSVVSVDLGRVGEGDKAGMKGLIWLTSKGICIGLPGGSFANLTERIIEFPSGTVGAGLYHDGNYIGTIQP